MCHTLVELLAKTHKPGHVFGSYYEDCIYLLLIKECVIVL